MSFNIGLVTEEKDLKDIYRLRFKVYCLEWGFEKPDKYPDGLLSDTYDKHSLQFAMRDSAQRLIGAVRLILHSEEGFPLENYCHLEITSEELPREKVAEISRLVIHRDFRRRAEDKYIYGPDEDRRIIGSFSFQPNYSYSRRYEDKYQYKQNVPRSNIYQNERRKRHEVIAGLYKAIYAESKRRQLSHWYAIMTKGIVALLDKFGLKFEPIGDPVDYHGIRTPYLGELAKIEVEMSEKDPQLYEECIRGL